MLSFFFPFAGGAAASARRSEPRREQRQRQRVACAHAALRHSDRRWWALKLLALLVLYWYKSTNTHAKGAAAGFAGLAAADELHALGCKVVVLEVLSLLALQVPMYKY